MRVSVRKGDPGYTEDFLIRWKWICYHCLSAGTVEKYISAQQKEIFQAIEEDHKNKNPHCNYKSIGFWATVEDSHAKA
jgi:hypothetical protein